MNVLMLGHSGVGKTTYVASMYGTMQSRTAGFSIKTKYAEDKERLLELYKAIRHGNYPAPSHQREKYSFQLCYQGEKVLSFRWIDYRGSSFFEKSQDSDDARILHRDLKASDAVIAFVDCNALASRNRYFPEIRRMGLLLAAAVQKTSRIFPLGIVLAKADLVGKPTAELLQPLKDLLEAVQASKRITGALIPIACGREPRNIALPLSSPSTLDFRQISPGRKSKSRPWKSSESG